MLVALKAICLSHLKINAIVAAGYFHAALFAEGVEDLAAGLEERVVLTVDVHGVHALHAVTVDVQHPAKN